MKRARSKAGAAESQEEVSACGFAVGSRLESPCVSEKRRLLGFNGTWLFSLLDKL